MIWLGTITDEEKAFFAVVGVPQKSSNRLVTDGIPRLSWGPQ